MSPLGEIGSVCLVLPTPARPLALGCIFVSGQSQATLAGTSLEDTPHVARPAQDPLRMCLGLRLWAPATPQRRGRIPMSRGRVLTGMVPVVVGASFLATVPAVAGGRGHGAKKVDHVVVIYEENHSFDNLYGMWGDVNGATVNGLPQAPLGHTIQTSQSGSPYTCLLQNDVNLTAPSPLSTQCIDPNPAVGQSHFINTPFAIDAYIPATATTCP